MKNKLLVLLITICTTLISANAQVKGYIYNPLPPATTNAVLDPNQDGYTSKTVAGFLGDDLTNSEIPYVAIRSFDPEPVGDLRRGPNGLFSEMVADPDGNTTYVYYDGTNFLIRLRISSIINGAKGYTLLIDADLKFGGSGPNADPNYIAQTTGTNGNPGFEYEVVYESGSRIAIYNVDGLGNTGDAVTAIATYPLTQMQQSFATTYVAGQPDEFYDFYVPVSGFGGFNPATTPFRAVGTTVMSPGPAILGPKSDLGGDDTKYPKIEDQWTSGITGQPGCTLAQIAAATCNSDPCTNPPVVNSPVASGASVDVTGTWDKSSYSTQSTATITLYKVGTPDVVLGTPVVVASGAGWTITGVTLANNDIVYAVATVAAGENDCYQSNRVTIRTCTPATTSACIVKTTTCDDKGFGGIAGSGVAGATWTVSSLTSGVTTVYTGIVAGDGSWGWDGPGSTGNGTNVCTGTGDVTQGIYTITQTEVGKCESAICYVIAGDPACATTTADPIITNTIVYAGTTPLSGTATAGATVGLFLNGGVVATTTATGGIYSFALSSYALAVGDVLSVRASSTSQECPSAFVTRTVSCFVSVPIITANDLGQVADGATITGVSSLDGATVTVYNLGGTSLGTATVVSGAWTSTVNAVGGTSYYATQATACGESAASGTVSALTATSGARCGTITGPSLPITAGVTTVSGTLASAVASTIVNLYMDGVFVKSTTTSGTTWSVTGLSTVLYNELYLYTGGVLSIGISTAGTLEVICPNTVTVACTDPTVPTYTVTPDPIVLIFPAQANFVITNSEFDVLYTVQGLIGNADENVTYSETQLGNGTAVLNLKSRFPDATQAYNVRIVAFNAVTGCFTNTADFTAGITSSACNNLLDTDGDGVFNCDDLDDDNDGILDSDEGGDAADADGDGIPNRKDLDSDGDGIPDVVEAGGSDPDNDGIVGAGTLTLANGGVNASGIPIEANSGAGYTATTTDADAIPDFLDLDSDDDGIVDVIEGQSTAGYVAPLGTDADGDGIDDAFDSDIAADATHKGGFVGVPSNVDGDVLPDYRDLDSDGDGISDQVESGITAALNTNDTDQDGILDGYDIDLISAVNNAGITNGGQTPSTFPKTGPGSVFDRDWRDNPNQIIWDGTAWFNGASSGIPLGNEGLNGYTSIRVMAGDTATMGNAVIIENFTIDEGAALKVTSCLTVTGNATNSGFMRLVSTGDGAGQYGQYLGEGLRNVSCQMFFDNGWHNIGFPVQITASQWVTENLTVGDSGRVLMNNIEGKQNFRWYDSYTSGGKEFGFFVAPDVSSPGSVTYSTHAYGKWNMVSDGTGIYGGQPDQDLTAKAFSYYIGDYFFNDSRVLSATGTTNDAEKTFTTSNNFGGFNMIPNIYPVSIDADVLWNDATYGFANVANLDQVIYMWDPTNIYNIPLPGDFGNGSYVAFDPETGTTISAAPEVAGKADHLIAPFQAFYIRRTDASAVRRIDEDLTNVYATNPLVAAGLIVDPAVTNVFIDVTMSPNFRTACESTKHLKTTEGPSIKDVILLKAVEVDSVNLGDATEIAFSDRYTADYDLGADIAKISAGGVNAPTLFTILGDKALVINKQSYPRFNHSILVGFRGPEGKNGTQYTMSTSMLPVGWAVYLEDKMTGAWHDLTKGSYVFTYSNDFRLERFVLHFNKTGTKIEPIELGAIAWGTSNGIVLKMNNQKSRTAEIVVSDMLGRVLHHNKSVDALREYVIPVSKGEPKLYLITVITPEYTTTVRVIW